jgi:hypothetical protein
MRYRWRWWWGISFMIGAILFIFIDNLFYLLGIMSCRATCLASTDIIFFSGWGWYWLVRPIEVFLLWGKFTVGGVRSAVVWCFIKIWIINLQNWHLILILLFEDEEITISFVSSSILYIIIFDSIPFIVHSINLQ